MFKSCVFSLFRLVVVLPWLLLPSIDASAQETVPGAGNGDQVINVFQPAPSDVRKPLMRAAKAIEEGRDPDAAYELGVLLASESQDDAEQQDYFMFDAENAASVGDACLKAEANRMLASLSPAGRQSYELQFGAQARALLDTALAEGDLDKLSDVIRRFLHTEAGHEASMLAGRLELGRGRPMAAALHFERIHGAGQAASRFDPELSILLATCWMYANMPEKAKETLVALKRRTPSATIRVGNQDERLFDQDEDALVWLDKVIGQRPSMLADQAVEWVVFRGNGQRNARVKGSPPMMNFRWRVPTPILRNDEKIIESVYEQYRDEGLAAIPVMQPLAVDNTILMRTPDKLLGVDFRSGKRVWVWPPWDDDESTRRVATQASGQGSMADAREQEVHQRLWEDAAHGQMSSDGKSVFLLHDLGFANMANYSPHAIMIMQGMRVNSPNAPRDYNELVSLSLSRQGAAHWIVGGETGEDEPKLAGAFFLGAPLPLGGKLYALAEFLGEIRLVVLNAETGKLLWQQQLAHVDTMTIQSDGLRRLSGASPSFEGGVLLCPTSAGALVAIDISTRSLLWGYQYRTIPKEMQQRGVAFMHMYRQQQSPRVGERWADATVTVADGRVLLTAVETGDLHCLDLLSGKPVWPSQKRDERLYVACVHDGKAVFVGSGEVSAINMTDGQPAWTEPVALNDPPSGRGFYTDRYYYLPTMGAELVKVDLDRGELVATGKTTTVLGNLVCYRDEVISQSPQWLTASYQSEPLRLHVEQALARNPNDVDALSRFGEIQRQEGKLQAALATLRKALTMDPENETTRSLMVDTLTAAIKEDFAANQQFAPEIVELMDRPTQQREYLRVMAHGWHQAGDLTPAFEAYVQLADLNAEMHASSGISMEKPEAIERHWDARVDCWLQGRVAELLASADDAQRVQMTDLIHQRYEAANRAEDIASLRRFLGYFGTAASADEIRLKLARRLIDSGELLAAELQLGRLQETLQGDARGVMTAELARLQMKARQYELALVSYEQLRDQWADVVCRDGKTGLELYEAAVKGHDLLQAAKDRSPWPVGDVEVSERAERINRFPSYRRIYPISINQLSGPAPSGLSLSLNQQENAITISDSRGKTLMNVSMGQRRTSYGNYSLTKAHLSGHLLVIFLGTEVLTIDMLQAMQNPSEAVLWRKPLNHLTPGQQIQQPRVKPVQLKHPWGGTRHHYVDPQQKPLATIGPVLDSGVFIMNYRELACVHPLTGEPIWTRGNLSQGSDVFGDSQHIFVVPHDSDKAQVFSALDGALLGERELELLENRWATCGGNVLAWEQDPQDGMLDLRLYDAWTGREIWHDQFPPGAKGTLVDCDEVAVMNPDGRLLIRSLRDDSIPVDVMLEREEQLATLHVLRSEEQYLVAANRVFSAEPNTPDAQIRSIVSGTATQLITGNLYALDRKTGLMQWDRPTAVKLFGFPENQPVNSPVAVFLRHVMPKGTRTSTGQHTSVLCIDRRDGRTIAQKDDIPAQTYTYEIQADRESETVTISLPQRTLELKLTDKPIREKPVDEEPQTDEADEADKKDETAETAPAEEQEVRLRVQPRPVPARVQPADFFGQQPR